MVEIYDTEGEYDEVYIVMLMKDNIINKKEILVKGIRYNDDIPFKEFGKTLIDNGLDNAKVIYNDINKCIIKYENIYYNITYKYLNKIENNNSISILYKITPKIN